MNKPFAFVFPGQGSQSVGMINDYIENYPSIKNTIQQASEIVGYDMLQLIQQGPEEILNQTDKTQPALLVSSYCCWQIWQNQGGPIPAVMAGHSLGEYTALLCAEVFDFATAVDLVAARGKFMQEAGQENPGAMAAIIGLDDADVMTLCEEAKIDNEVLAPANFNTLGQVVISGHENSIQKAIELAEQKGARLAQKLAVSVPCHCELMRPAAEKMAQKLQQVTFKSPKIPVIHNVDAKSHEQSDEIKSILIEQIYSPVRWVESVKQMTQFKINAIVEAAPGRVLTGLNKRIDRKMKTLALNNIDNFNKVLMETAELET